MGLLRVCSIQGYWVDVSIAGPLCKTFNRVVIRDVVKGARLEEFIEAVKSGEVHTKRFLWVCSLLRGCW